MIPPRKIAASEEPNVDSWLMSYADMITLLMCFFIIFVSVSEPKRERISAIASGMSGKFGTVDVATPFDGVIGSLQSVVEKHQSFRDVTIDHGEKAIEMELSSAVFFKPDSAELADDKLPILREIIATLKTVNFLEYAITVEAHTSDLPPKSGLFATNWELSSARASRMVRALIEGGLDAKNLRAVGLADTHPKVPNLDATGNPIAANREKNERVVVKLERLG